MLKELANLISHASYAAGVGDEGTLSTSQIDNLKNAISEAVVAVGRHDDEKRKTDEAICLLFRAYHESENDSVLAATLVQRAERLLGFAQLEKAGDA